jgi:hypothetical protein
MTTRVRVRLIGGNAELGRIPSSDVARLLLGIERALARAAGHVTGRTVKPTGRWESVVEAAVKLRLVGLQRGSLVAVLEVPEPAKVVDSLIDLADIEHLGELALDRAMRTASGKSKDPDVAAIFADWADELGIGYRYDAVEIRRREGTKWHVARIDEGRRAQLANVASSRLVTRGQVVGRLTEADFETGTAKLRLASGRIPVQFEPEHADDVQSALRQQARVAGSAVVDPETNQVASIRITEIRPARQLETGLTPGDYLDPRTIQEKALSQGITGPQDLRELVDEDATEAEIAAVMVDEDE